MPADAFFDTSVLIYIAVANDKRSLIADSYLQLGGVVSVQVLNEFVNVTRRKLKLDWQEIRQFLTLIRRLCGEPLPIKIETHEAALIIAQRYGYHVYDSLMIASAIEAACTTLYSEDMQNGQTIGLLTIRNPFVAP